MTNPKKQPLRRAVLYARKSTESEDKQIQSIGDQIDTMKKIAEDEGLEIVDIFSESKSAKEPDIRPVYQEMIKNIKAGKYDIVLVWDMSRLSRNPVDGGVLTYMLDNGTISKIRTHERWYEESDDLLLSIENSMNTRFIKDLKAKVKRGMDSKAEKGDFPGCPPIGYMNDYYGRRIIKDPEMWDKVSELWRKALTGTYNVSELTKIADEELRIRRPQKKRQGGKPLCHNAIRNVLSNPFYTGKFRWNDRIYNGNHPAMITEAEFEQVQGFLKPNHSSRPKKEPYQFLLRGLIRCSECGYAIVTEKKYKKLADGTTKEYRYCHCSDKSPHQRCKNHAVYIREEKLVRQIKDELCKYTIDEDFFQLAVEALMREDDIEVAEQNKRLSDYDQRIKRKKNELDGLRRALYTGMITDEAYFISEQTSLEKDMTALENERNKIMNATHGWREKAVDAFMFARYAKEDFDSDDLEKKRTVIKKLGADLRLSGRTIQFTPIKYLVPIEKHYSEIKHQTELVRTAPQQRKKDLKEGLISQWCSSLH